MKTILRTTATAAAVAAALSLASTGFTQSYNPSELAGAMGAAETYDRVITITPETKAVNVSRGEDVKFVDTATGQSFVWNFNALIDAVIPPFDLASVAPSGALGGQHVMAYVESFDTGS